MTERTEPDADVVRLVDTLDQLHGNVAAVVRKAGAEGLDVPLCDLVHRFTHEAEAFVYVSNWPSAPMLAAVARQLAEALDVIVLDDDDGIDRLDAIPQMIALLRHDIGRPPLA